MPATGRPRLGLSEYDPRPDSTTPSRACASVEVLEKVGEGLNLTWEVRDGVSGHSKGHGGPAARGRAGTLEGDVVLYSDRIAYINHDIDDASALSWSPLTRFPQDCLAVLGSTHAQRISTMVGEIVRCSAGSPKITLGSGGHGHQRPQGFPV